MGNEQAQIQRDTESMTLLKNNPSITADRLTYLFDKFAEIDVEQQGYISKEQLQKYCGLDSSELTTVILDSLCMNENQAKGIQFASFVQALTIFEQGSEQQKLQYIFGLLDSNNDGKLCKADLIQGFKVIKDDYNANTDLEQVADNTLEYADKDRDTYLNFKEFQSFYNEKLEITI